MIFKKLLSFILIGAMLGLFVLSGCVSNSHEEGFCFSQPSENIAQIEIICCTENFKIEVLQCIEEKDRTSFILDFENVPCLRSRAVNDPPSVEYGDKGFIVTYANGDYEEIYHCMMERRRKGFTTYTYRYYFDKDAFEQLLEKYME